MNSYRSFNSIKDAIKAKKTNCLSLTKSYIYQIKKNKNLNAFAEVFEDEALARAKEIDVKNFEKELYTKNMPHPDILIRTGGTRRLSNFLLWQLAYSEIFFIDKLWPDFNDRDYNNIIKKFYNIKRNFGKI